MFIGGTSDEADQHVARDELVTAIGGPAECGRILDEFAAVTVFTASMRCSCCGPDARTPKLR
jgi:hypothetical protein